MNNIDKHYQTLLQDILDNGVVKSDRTGTGTISVFGRQIRHKMSDGFPLLTTKKMAWKSIVAELLWFLRGDTNIKFLLDYDCHIWDGDAYKNYSKTIDNVIDGYKSGDIMGMQPHIEKWFSNSDELTPLTKEQFIKNIKTDKEFAERWGDLGPIYGKQWRRWETDDLDAPRYEHWKKDIDQIQNLIDELKTNPDSRRLMVNAWNVGEINHMVLPPCHYGFQVYTRPTTREEKIINPGKYRAISLMWNQRSVDTFLGLPFNVASYALLLEIIAKEVNMIPDELIGNLGDVHLYSNHIEQAKMQILRKPYSLPKVNITERNWYQHQLVKERLGPKSFNDKILSYRPDCFELVGYESHSGIKAPLSN
jgi:thymidylate synthase